MIEKQQNGVPKPHQSSSEPEAAYSETRSSASDEKKIAWLTIGTVSLGIWAAFFGFIMIVSVARMAPFGLIDAAGVGILIGMVLIFVVLPGFGSWRCFKSSQRLGRQRRDKFVNKQAFE